MVRGKKAQAALEYLVTYGWVFLVVLGVIAALSFFGLLNPQRFFPEDCDFGVQMECVDHVINSDGTVQLRFRNAYDADIDITAIYFDSVDYLSAPVTIVRGQVGTVGTTPLPGSYSSGRRSDVDLVIAFERTGGSGNTHTVAGKVFGEIN